MQEAITSAKQIDEQSKPVGFYQDALDHVARQGYSNASLEIGSEEGLESLKISIQMNPDQSRSKRTIYRISRKD